MSSSSPPNEPLSKYRFTKPIPRSVRDYGKALDPRILEAGDLLLFSHKKPGYTSRKIIERQRAAFNEVDARWHHVAISGGGFEICEATVSGVKAYEYWNYMTGQYDIRIRRLIGASAEIRNKVAYYAATNVGTSYGFGNLSGITRMLSGSDPWQKRYPASSGVICSQLYFEACMRVNILLAPIPPEKACPAQLSVSEFLMDIELNWLPV